MKRLLATTAVATMAFAGAASAQSVLERVLGQIDNSTNLASVNGTFANIAENLGGAASVTTFEITLTAAEAAAMGIGGGAAGTYELTQAQIDNLTFASDYIEVPAGAAINTATGEVITAAAYAALAPADQAAYIENGGGAAQFYAPDNIAGQTPLAALTNIVNFGDFTPKTITSGLGVDGINGSINNTLDGIDQATQQAIAAAGVSAIEWNMPTVDLGDMATTALGAVNTGDITLGVNSSVDEAKTSTTNAISAVVDQLGGSADTGAIVLNVASNMTGVNGSINNVMNEVNGSIGNLSTTALGAVNTGTIVSGVDAAVAGIVGSTSGGTTVATQ